ncbi:MAG: hypothetical protein R3Y43_03040 [Alphaproteobacteria bacterium]
MNKIKIITGGTIGLTFLLNSGMSSATDTCTVASNCAELGYTETSCEGNSIKCPFDTSKMYCGSTYTGPDVVSCATVGVWYNADGTCSSSDTSNAIGLVYWVSPSAKGGLVMSLTQSENVNFATAYSACTGVWRLPEISEVILMGNQYPCSVSGDEASCVSSVDGQFTTLNAKLSTDLITSEYYWASSRYYDYTTYRYVARLSDGNVNNYYATSTSGSGRCVLAF